VCVCVCVRVYVRVCVCCSSDGQFLFFNSLNSGGNTSLFYSRIVNATYFEFMGEVQGVNGKPPHLDAVARFAPRSDTEIQTHMIYYL